MTTGGVQSFAQFAVHSAIIIIFLVLFYSKVVKYSKEKRHFGFFVGY